ncbi:thiamine pyrophosphate-binding protein [Amycolatopsis pithecellobii]|uniref:Thiamine pyrophosphate-binding protein n=1 Tax=Amycolatopsis pithecellobii TaxID=664692 RepID=A0A6N7Z7G7_9PSEU|nr:thiamine pyrophosphate-binding protein [Amycolatopsis pithecellobii]MTD57040.1 hypothetical protein [Amycolatopsis pithecellobii]
MTPGRTGRHALAEQLVAAGVTRIYGNPGTTEQAFIDVLQDYPLTLILALHEGVAIGAAEGDARASRTPSVALLHTAPGLGNAMGMLSNANLGHTPMVVLVGDMPVTGRFTEPALSGPIARMAAPVTKWTHEVLTADEIPQVIRRAFTVAAGEPCGPVVLVLPADVMDSPTDAGVAPVGYVHSAQLPSEEVLRETVNVLAAATSPALVVGDGAGDAEAVAGVADALGAPIYSGYVTEAAVPAGHPLDAGGVPLFDPDALVKRFAPHDCVLALGSELFKQAFPGPATPLPLDVRVVQIGLDAWELGKNQPGLTILADPAATATELAARLSVHPRAADFAARRARIVDATPDPEPPRVSEHAGPMTVTDALGALAPWIPGDAVIVDEAVSAAPELSRFFPPRPHSWFRSRGGGLGAGMSIPLGLSLARPDRPVFAFVGDGSAMYTITALWTAAHHDIPVRWVVLNNRGYRMLKLNTLAYLGEPAPGRRFIGADLADPAIDFVDVARGLGVRAVRAGARTEVTEAMREHGGYAGPLLLELIVDGAVSLP